MWWRGILIYTIYVTKYILLWNLRTYACPPQEKNEPETITDFYRKFFGRSLFWRQRLFSCLLWVLYFLWTGVLRNGWECFYTIIVKLRVWPPPVYTICRWNSFRHFKERKGRLLYALYSTLPPLYMVTRDKKENIEGGSNTAFENWIEHVSSPEAVSIINNSQWLDAL